MHLWTKLVYQLGQTWEEKKPLCKGVHSFYDEELERTIKKPVSFINYGYLLVLGGEGVHFLALERWSAPLKNMKLCLCYEFVLLRATRI